MIFGICINSGMGVKKILFEDKCKQMECYNKSILKSAIDIETVEAGGSSFSGSNVVNKSRSADDSTVTRGNGLTAAMGMLFSIGTETSFSVLL